MPRTRNGAISRRSVLTAALSIIDTEGLREMTVRRLGRELDVQSPSLYHHFKSKDEILAGVVSVVLGQVRTPDEGSEARWQDWLPANARVTRKALMSHPNLIAVVLQRRQRRIGEAEVASALARLAAEGLPADVIVPLFHSVERLALVGALQSVGGLPGSRIRLGDEKIVAVERAYEQARAGRTISDTQVFDFLLATMISAVEDVVAARSAGATGG